MKNPPLLAKVFTVLFSGGMIGIYVLVMGGLLVGSVLLPGTKSGRMTPERMRRIEQEEREWAAEQTRIAATQPTAPSADPASAVNEPFRFLPADSSIIPKPDRAPSGAFLVDPTKPHLFPGSKSAVVITTHALSGAAEPTTRPTKLIWGSKSGRVIDASDITFTPGTVEFPAKKEAGQ